MLHTVSGAGSSTPWVSKHRKIPFVYNASEICERFRIFRVLCDCEFYVTDVNIFFVGSEFVGW